MSCLGGLTGEIEISAIEALSYEALRDWVSARLQGRDAHVAGDSRQGELPYAAIAEAYPRLSHPRQVALADVLIAFVNDMAGAPDSVWRGEAGHQLLLLAQRVCTWEQLGPVLVEMAERRVFFTADVPEPGEDLHYRVLQTLVEIGWRDRPELWREQVVLAPDRYAGVAFSGLALVGPEHAAALLCEIPWSDAVEDQMHTELPFYIAQYGAAVVRPLLAQCLARLGARAADVVREIAAAEHLPLTAWNQRRTLRMATRVLLSRSSAARERYESTPIPQP